MNFKQQTGEIIHKIKSGKKITLSGEIIISTKLIDTFSKISDRLFQYTKSIIESMNNQYPYIKFSVSSGICDIDIKLFMYNKTLFKNKFPEELRRNLEILVNKLYEFEGVYVRLDVIVQEDNFRNVCKYKYLNNETEVNFKNTDSIIKQSWPLKIIKTIK